MPSTYEKILGRTGTAVRTAANVANKFSSLTSNPASPSSIRDAYLNGFFAETSKFTPNVFSRLFDEPTYLTFRIEFNFNPNMYQNDIPGDMSGVNYKNLDDFPEPLLAIGRESNEPVNTYSSYTYLRDALGEKQRANMLYTFVNGLKDIQENYPYYFQSVEGLATLLKVAPAEGIRLKPGENTITIKCLEGLDLKITQLMQLYKNIAWDDYYQRWILVDMMRFFNMKIYVSEIRLFHSGSASVTNAKAGYMYNFNGDTDALNANSRDKIRGTGSVLNSMNSILNNATAITQRSFGTRSTVAQIASAMNTTVDTVSEIGSSISGALYNLCNNAINDVMPTICFDCHLCEFDISDTAGHLNTLSSSNKGNNSPEPVIKINVGKLYVKQVYPINASLETDTNHYVINLNKELMAGSYFDDEYLRKNDRGPETMTNIMSNKSQDLEIDGISKTINRMYSKKNLSSRVIMGIDAKNSDAPELSYRVDQINKGMAAESLIRMGANLIGDNRSEAVEISENKENKIRKSLDQYTNIEVSAATSDDNSLEPLRNKSNYTGSSATDASDSNMSRLRQWFQESPLEFTEATRYLEKIRDFSYDNLNIQSAAVSEGQQREMGEVVAKGILENLKASTATDQGNILQKMAGIILNDTRSAATDTNNTITAFDKLNR